MFERFTSEAIWAWGFLGGKVFNKFNLFFKDYDLSFKLSNVLI